MKYIPREKQIALAERAYKKWQKELRRAVLLKETTHRLRQLNVRARPRRKPIIAPRVLGFRENYNETVSFVEVLRKRQEDVAFRLRSYIELATIEKMSPGVAVILIAEFDRERRNLPTKSMRPVSISNWDPQIRDLLIDLGAMELLNIQRAQYQSYELLPNVWTVSSVN